MEENCSMKTRSLAFEADTAQTERTGLDSSSEPRGRNYTSIIAELYSCSEGRDTSQGVNEKEVK